MDGALRAVGAASGPARVHKGGPFDGAAGVLRRRRMDEGVAPGHRHAARRLSRVASPAGNDTASCEGCLLQPSPLPTWGFLCAICVPCPVSFRLPSLGLAAGGAPWATRCAWQPPPRPPSSARPRLVAQRFPHKKKLTRPGLPLCCPAFLNLRSEVCARTHTREGGSGVGGHRGGGYVAAHEGGRWWFRWSAALRLWRSAAAAAEGCGPEGCTPCLAPLPPKEERFLCAALISAGGGIVVVLGERPRRARGERPRTARTARAPARGTGSPRLCRGRSGPGRAGARSGAFDLIRAGRRPERASAA